MPLTKNLGGEIVTLTKEEEDAVLAEWAAEDAKPKQTIADLVENDIAGNRALRALVTVLANRLGISRAVLVAAIRAAAT